MKLVCSAVLLVVAVSLVVATAFGFAGLARTALGSGSSLTSIHKIGIIVTALGFGLLVLNTLVDGITRRVAPHMLRRSPAEEAAMTAVVAQIQKEVDEEYEVLPNALQATQSLNHPTAAVVAQTKKMLTNPAASKLEFDEARKLVGSSTERLAC